MQSQESALSMAGRDPPKTRKVEAVPEITQHGQCCPGTNPLLCFCLPTTWVRLGGLYDSGTQWASLHEGGKDMECPTSACLSLSGRVQGVGQKCRRENRDRGVRSPPLLLQGQPGPVGTMEAYVALGAMPKRCWSLAWEMSISKT